ncbi:MAG: peptidoglycan-associated lipoprotein Pal [Acidobacteria bacterium]|nr:peptidoglycan-associated lipoprotein Pal [Acidobacteriota bacterium]
MRFRFFTLIAVGVLLAACASEPDEFGASPSAGPAVGSADDTGAVTVADPRSQEWLVLNVGDRVFFDYDKSNLTSDDQDAIERVVAWMHTYPDVTLTLEGHADERGTREYNLALGERRANSVRRYMEALGIAGARLSVISYGNEQPAVPGSNELAWAQNRRAVFVVN